MKKIKFSKERLDLETYQDTSSYYDHIARYFFASQFATEKVVADIGCGVGYGCFIVSNYAKAKKVIGIDSSEEALNYANQKYGNVRIKYIIDNAESLLKVEDKSIDLGLAFEVIEHLKDGNKFLENIKRIIKPNGLFLVSTPNKYTYPAGNQYHIKEFYPDEFIKLLKKYFKKVKLLHQKFEIAEVISGDGESAVSLDKEFTSQKNESFFF